MDIFAGLEKIVNIIMDMFIRSHGSMIDHDVPESRAVYSLLELNATYQCLSTA